MRSKIRYYESRIRTTVEASEGTMTISEKGSARVVLKKQLIGLALALVATGVCAADTGVLGHVTDPQGRAVSGAKLKLISTYGSAGRQLRWLTPVT